MHTCTTQDVRLVKSSLQTYNHPAIFSPETSSTILVETVHSSRLYRSSGKLDFVFEQQAGESIDVSVIRIVLAKHIFTWSI